MAVEISDRRYGVASYRLRSRSVGLVKVKMLPFDNKSEFQVILDMPESATLEETAAAAMDMEII